MTRDPEELTAPLVVGRPEEERAGRAHPDARRGRLESAPAGRVPNPRMVARDLNFYYGKFHALRDVNLAVQQDAITALIGPSGCGKSTLIRCFNRIYNLYPDQHATGELLLDGKNLLASHQDLNRLRARVGMVFQKATPFPMSIYDNIAFGVKLYERLSRAEMDE